MFSYFFLGLRSDFFGQYQHGCSYKKTCTPLQMLETGIQKDIMTWSIDLRWWRKYYDLVNRLNKLRFFSCYQPQKGNSLKSTKTHGILHVVKNGQTKWAKTNEQLDVLIHMQTIMKLKQEKRQPISSVTWLWKNSHRVITWTVMFEKRFDKAWFTLMIQCSLFFKCSNISNYVRPFLPIFHKLLKIFQA